MTIEDRVAKLEAAFAAMQAFFGQTFVDAQVPDAAQPMLALYGEPNPMDAGIPANVDRGDPNAQHVNQPFPGAQTGEPNPTQG